MKISISLGTDDVQFLDEQAREGRYASRSAVMQAAVRLLREQNHVDSYAAAWTEWEESGDHDAWDTTSKDGLR